MNSYYKSWKSVAKRLIVFSISDVKVINYCSAFGGVTGFWISNGLPFLTLFLAYLRTEMPILSLIFEPVILLGVSPSYFLLIAIGVGFSPC